MFGIHFVTTCVSKENSKEQMFQKKIFYVLISNSFLRVCTITISMIALKEFLELYKQGLDTIKPLEKTLPMAYCMTILCMM